LPSLITATVVVRMSRILLARAISGSKLQRFGVPGRLI
jgi:hypothetical protein